MAAAIGWGRVEVLRLPEWGGIWPTRYSLMAVPILIAAYFIWEFYDCKKLKSVAQGVLFLAMCFIIPLNTIHGFWWYDWYLQGVRPLEQDIRSRLPLSILADRNREFLYRWMDPTFDKLRMLKDESIGLFALIQDDPVKPENSIAMAKPTQKHPVFQSPASTVVNPMVTNLIRYHMTEAGEVYFVWGINGWQVLTEKLRPKGTVVKNKVMHTPMIQIDETYVTKITVPAGSSIDFGFLITKKQNSFDITWPLWDKGATENPIIISENGVTDIKATISLAMVTQEIRYYKPEADEVFFVWGLNGWHVAPEGLRPPGTEVKNRVMHTPMVKEENDFVVKIRVPVGTMIDYGLMITERRGLFDIVTPIWEGDNDFQVMVLEDSFIEVKGKTNLFGDLSKIDYGFYLLLGIAILFGTGVLINRFNQRHALD